MNGSGKGLFEIAVGENDVRVFASEFKRKVFEQGATVEAILLPVAVPPVNDMAEISGCSIIACPALGPRP